MQLDYNIIIFIVGLLATGATITTVGNKVYAWLNQGRSLFSWQGFVDQVNAVLQVIGLKRELRKSVKEYIDQLTEAETTLREFRVSYADDSSKTAAAFGQLTLDQARSFTAQMFDLLKKLDDNVARIRLSISEVTGTASYKMDFQNQASVYGVNLTAPSAQPQQQPMPTASAGGMNQATMTALATTDQLKADLDDAKSYVLYDNVAKQEFRMPGSQVKTYIKLQNLVIGTTAFVVPVEMVNAMNKQPQTSQQQQQYPPKPGVSRSF